eukprot:gene27463-36122_t
MIGKYTFPSTVILNFITLKGSEEWAEKCWVQWNNRFMKLRAASSQSKKTDPADEFDSNSSTSTVHLSRNTKRQTLSIFFNGQSPPVKKGLVTPPLSPNSSVKEKDDSSRFSFISLRKTLSGSNFMSTSQQQSPDNSQTNTKIDMNIPYSMSAPLTPEVVDNMDQSTVQSKMTSETLDSMKSSSGGDADNPVDQTTPTAMGGRDLLEEFNSSNCGYIIDCAKSNSNGSSNYESATVSHRLGINIHEDEDEDEDIKRKITDPEIQALLFGNNIIMEPHPKVTASSTSSSSSSSSSSAGSSSTSTSTTVGDVTGRQNSRDKSPCPSSTAAQDGSDCVDEDDDHQSNGSTLTGKDLRTAHISSLSEDAVKLAELFRIKSPSVFDGEYLGKRASPFTGERQDVDEVPGAEVGSFALKVYPITSMQEFGPNTLRIHTRGGLYIELKLPTETMACWRKAILSLV